MPRRTPPGRLQEVASSACRVFIGKGYRRALLTDVGKDLGLSHGILYHYVENKEALFELALVYAMDPDALAALTVPLPAPPKGRALELVKAWAEDQARFPVLSAAAGDSAADPGAELAGIIDELYAFMERNHRVLALIARSELDVPDVHSFFFSVLRRAYIGELTSYIRRRGEAGALRRVSDAAVAARFIIESIAWFSWHRKGDPRSDATPDDQVRQTVRELLLAAFVPSRAGSTTSTWCVSQVD